jgi:transcriptional regulator with XRE-family HTH domain
MIDIRNLPDAWEMIDRLGGEEAKEKNELYDIYYKISTTLFDYRLKYDLSQKKLAEKLGVTQPMVAKLESGDYNYTIEQLWKIANKLRFKFSINFQELEQEISVISRPEGQDNVVDYYMDNMAVGS